MYCNCEYHRYDVVYICGCGKIVSYSSGESKNHAHCKQGIFIESIYYHHDDTILTLFDRLQGFGALPYDSTGFNNVYFLVSKLQ